MKLFWAITIAAMWCAFGFAVHMWLNYEVKDPVTLTTNSQ